LNTGKKTLGLEDLGDDDIALGPHLEVITSSRYHEVNKKGVSRIQNFGRMFYTLVPKVTNWGGTYCIKTPSWYLGTAVPKCVPVNKIK